VLTGVVIAVGFGFGVIAWWVGLLASFLALGLTVGTLRWTPSRRGLVRFAAWTLKQAQ